MNGKSKRVLGENWLSCPAFLPSPSLCTHAYTRMGTQVPTHRMSHYPLALEPFRSRVEWRSFPKSPEFSLSCKRSSISGVKDFPALVSTYLPSFVTTHFPLKASWSPADSPIDFIYSKIVTAPSVCSGHLLLLTDLTHLLKLSVPGLRVPNSGLT